MASGLQRLSQLRPTHIPTDQQLRNRLLFQVSELIQQFENPVDLETVKEFANDRIKDIQLKRETERAEIVKVNPVVRTSLVRRLARPQSVRQKPVVRSREELHQEEVERYRSLFNGDQEIQFEDFEYERIRRGDELHQLLALVFVSPQNRIVIYKVLRDTPDSDDFAIFIQLSPLNQFYQFKDLSDVDQLHHRYELRSLFKEIVRTPELYQDELDEMEKIDRDFVDEYKQIVRILDLIYAHKSQMPL